MIVMEPKEETIEEAKRRLLLAMIDAGKSREFMAGVMHMSMEELDEILKAENQKKEKMEYNFGDSLLEEWDNYMKSTSNTEKSILYGMNKR